MFDSLYYDIYELYIWPYFQNIKKILNTEYGYDRKPNIVQKFHLLLSKHCANYFYMKNLDNFNCLCSNKNSNNNDENYIDNINITKIRTSSNDSSNSEKNKINENNLEKNEDTMKNVSVNENNIDSNSQTDQISEVKNESNN